MFRDRAKKIPMSALVVQTYVIGWHKILFTYLHEINDDAVILNYASDLRWFRSHILTRVRNIVIFDQFKLSSNGVP